MMMKDMSHVTQERLKELLDYDSSTGIFTWKDTGKIAGRGYKKQYIDISIDGETFKAHRLAWLYVYGGIVPQILDHRDGIKYNNAIDNLRACTKSENEANKFLQRNNTSGVKGIWLQKSGKWRAAIMKDNKRIHLGYYSTKEEAYAAYCEAAERIFGEFARLK